VNSVVDPKYQFLLQAVYDHFRVNAAWPLARQLEIELEDGLDPLGGLQQVCIAIGSDKVRCWSSYDAGGVCQLRLAGFLECCGAEDDVNRFLGAVRYCAKKYRDAKGVAVTVSAGDFVAELQCSEPEARRVGLMLLDATDLWTTATQPPKAWPSFTPGPLARSMKDVASLREYFEVAKADEERQRAEALARTKDRPASAERPKQPKQKRYDVFISYAYEDKEAVARPLADALRENFTVWYDEFALRVGDSLRREIERGLASSRFGVVILSPSFFKKEWPQKELDGLTAREVEGRKVILPVWHEIDAEGVRRVAPSLADKVAARTSEGIGVVAMKLLEAVTERERLGERGTLPVPALPASPASPTARGPISASAALAAQRKLDVYDELLEVMHEATGRIVHLYGMRQEPLFTDWSVEQLEAYMTQLGFPGRTKAAILADWNTDQRDALKALRETARQGEIAEAERVLARASNYLLAKAPYVARPISAKARAAFEPLREILANAKFPDPGGKGHLISGWSEAAAARVEELAELMRVELTGETG